MGDDQAAGPKSGARRVERNPEVGGAEVPCTVAVAGGGTLNELGDAGIDHHALFRPLVARAAETAEQILPLGQ